MSTILSIISIFSLIFNISLPQIVETSIEEVFVEYPKVEIMSGENFYLINSNTFVAINPNFPLLKDHVFNILPKEDIPSSPEKESSIITRETMVTITAYSSTSFECDKSPFITASGTYVREGIVATNFLPFGTKIKIPEIFGEKIFVVEDRMAKRYLYVVDVWFPSYHEALNFGKKYTRIEILN